MAVFIEFMCGWVLEFWKACPFNHFCTQVAECSESDYHLLTSQLASSHVGEVHWAASSRAASLLLCSLFVDCTADQGAAVLNLAIVYAALVSQITRAFAQIKSL